MAKFNAMPKMFTTEPSVDEVKMKKGGRAKKMMDGGAPMVSPMVAPARRRMPVAKPMAMERRAPMLMRKAGGKVESLREIEAHERNEKAELKRVEGELKKHESMKASKAHKGLKAGGSPAPKAGPNVVGGLAGGLEATRPVKSRMTGGVRAPGYKAGGDIGKAMAFETKTTKKPKIDANDKVVSAENLKTVRGNKGIEGAGYKKGGGLKKYASGGMASKGMAVARKYETKINDASSPKKVKGGSGGIEGSQYKTGGHVAMKCHAQGGFTTMKKMQKC